MVLGIRSVDKKTGLEDAPASLCLCDATETSSEDEDQ